MSLLVFSDIIYRRMYEIHIRKAIINEIHVWTDTIVSSRGEGLMALYIAFAVFMASMFIAIFANFSMVYALLIGLVCFLTVGKLNGFSVKSMAVMSKGTIMDSIVVIKVMLIIGMLTAIWRMCGTVTIFVYYGMKIIQPDIFLIVTFLLCCLLSYAIGTSFGVAGTVGIIFMALARSGGVDPTITAGVIMSGIYFGDRCSPVSSSANMVAGITGTEIFSNVKVMLKTGALPFAIALVVYIAMSLMNPIGNVDETMVHSFETEFNLSLWAFVPAIVVLGLPLIKVGVINAILASIASGILVAWFVQGASLLEILKTCILGYEAGGSGLASILNGGGLLSMVEIAVILVISGAYSGIFSGTKMLESLQEKLSKACSKFGRFAVMVMMSIAMACIFCNQTIGTLMCNDLLKKPYLDGGGTAEELAIDMENSVILIACMIPWSIGCSVPLAFLGVGAKTILFAVFMYMVPICYLFTKKKWYSN